MSDIRSCFLDAAHSLVDMPFNKHYLESDPCANGVMDSPVCKERGLGVGGVDCMGAVIVSVCIAKGIKTRLWLPEYRHMEQLEELGEPRRGKPGDAVVFYSKYYDGPQHMGVLVDADAGLVIHAISDASRVVKDHMTLDDTCLFIGPEILADIPDLATLANNR
jgi:hypothetical protein